MIEYFGYLDNIMVPMKDMRKTLDYVHAGHEMGDSWNHSDDELAFLSYWNSVEFVTCQGKGGTIDEIQIFARFTSSRFGAGPIVAVGIG